MSLFTRVLTGVGKFLKSPIPGKKVEPKKAPTFQEAFKEVVTPVHTEPREAMKMPEFFKHENAPLSVFIDETLGGYKRA